MSLHYLTRGNPEGDPIVFLHGGSFTGRMWLDIAGMLPEFHNIIPDLPGHGKSADHPLTSLEQAADAVADVIRTLFAGKPVHLVGLSFGGYVSLYLLIRHPDLIQRAMISGIQAGAMPHPKLVLLAITLSSPFMRFQWYREKMVEMMGLDDYSLASDEESRANATPKTMRRVGKLAVEFDVRDQISAIATPTLLAAGTKELPTILEGLKLFQTEMPNCQAVRVPDLGHGWCGEDPELFADTVRAWLNDQPLPDRLKPV
ncbi:alpha/beta fold hydrolase [Parasphingorhabdus cellanae]|uniref:Alpha/beta hydrolase n=1 Tax=Parasphingorhabdus cellanae TaxID=2806553 RepID=A0ABX7T837_9SPHN|nr:alpha/beta hydrolase [Parasphingorhabdus cellanae]QTD56609.1 alpha/beta hydrolase [Parasphingorhabdus cellanae]